MERRIVIWDDRGGFTTGETSEDVSIGDRVTIIGHDENGFDFEATGVVAEL